MCPVDTTSATNQPYDFSSLSPHIDMESASSKEPKSQFKAGTYKVLAEAQGAAAVAEVLLVEGDGEGAIDVGVEEGDGGAARGPTARRRP